VTLECFGVLLIEKTSLPNARGTMNLETNTATCPEASFDDVRCYQDLCVLLLTAPAFAMSAGLRQQRFACCMSAAFKQKDNTQQESRNRAQRHKQRTRKHCIFQHQPMIQELYRTVQVSASSCWNRKPSKPVAMHVCSSKAQVASPSGFPAINIERRSGFFFFLETHVLCLQGV
jgi:hypothetical protein